MLRLAEPVCTWSSGEVDIPGNPAFSRAIQQREQMPTFIVPCVASDQNDQSGILLLHREPQEVVAIARYHEETVFSCVREGFGVSRGYR